MKKKMLICFLVIAFCSFGLVLTYKRPIEAKAENITASPILWYDFSDSSNYGKDKMNHYDLMSYSQVPDIITGDKGIKSQNNTFYMNTIANNEDFSDYLKNFSLTLSFKPENAGTSRIVCTGNYSVLDGFVLFYVKEADGKCYLVPDINTSSGLNGQTDGHFKCWKEITDVNTWHTFAASVNSIEKKVMYSLDGEIICEFTYAGDILMENLYQAFSLFGLTHTGGGGSTDFYNGYLDDVRVYDFAMSSDQLKSIRQSEQLSVSDEAEYISSVESITNQYVNSNIQSEFILKSLPSTLTLTGSKGTEKESEIKWVSLKKNGNSGVAYGYILSKEIANVLGVFAFAEIEFSETAELPLILAPAFTENMVLQRNRCRIFGQAGNTEVTVTVDGYEPKSVQCENGDWCIEFNLNTSSTPKTVIISTAKGESVELKNVLIGEVWYCSGQSNMDWNVQETKGYTLEMLTNADYSNLRFMKRTMFSAFEPTMRYSDKWFSPNTFADVSGQSAYATCYALNLASSLKAKEGETVPIGIISAAVGGSGIEQWMSSESIAEAGSRIDTAAGKYDTQYYYGMFYSLKGLQVKGALWYQGEDNVFFTQMYRGQFACYLNDIRELFEDENLPTIVVQLPQFNMIEWAEFRNMQWGLSLDNENVYTVCGIEYGEYADIHPKEDKYQFSARASDVAMKCIYADENASGLSPYPISIYNEDDQIIITLSDNANLHTLYNRKPDGFEIKVGGAWQKADADIINGTIIINGFSGTPTDVRYFYLDNVSKYENGFNYIYNSKSLPVAPFILPVGEKTFNVNISTQNCTVNSDSKFTVEKGKMVSFTVIPAEGYRLKCVTQNGVEIYVSGNNITSSVIMTDSNITVICEKISAEQYFDVTLNKGEKGKVILSSKKVVKGGSISLVIEPNNNYKAVVKVNGNTVTVVDNTVALNNVGGSINIEVEFIAENMTEESGCSSAFGGGLIQIMAFGLISALLFYKKARKYNSFRREK
jgi:sialate O-acetylesterase